MSEPEFLRKTRESYDAIAEAYHARLRGELDSKPLEAGLLSAFAALVRDSGSGPVLDVGCGTGRVAARLRDLGLDVSGTDLSPGMLAVARREYPGIPFTEGSLLALPVPDGSQAAVMAWYSLIHMPAELLPQAAGELRRALAPGGWLLLAFQAGDEVMHQSQAAGISVDLNFRRMDPDAVAALLAEAGLKVRARLLREPDADGDYPEKVPQAFLLARRPA